VPQLTSCAAALAAVRTPASHQILNLPPRDFLRTASHSNGIPTACVPPCKRSSTYTGAVCVFWACGRPLPRGHSELEVCAAFAIACGYAQSDVLVSFDDIIDESPSRCSQLIESSRSASCTHMGPRSRPRSHACRRLRTNA